jgi:hypothetical protein
MGCRAVSGVLTCDNATTKSEPHGMIRAFGLGGGGGYATSVDLPTTSVSLQDNYMLEFPALDNLHREDSAGA